MTSPNAGPLGLSPSAMPGGPPTGGQPVITLPDQRAELAMPQAIGGAARFEQPISTFEAPPPVDRNALIDEKRTGHGLLPVPILFIGGGLLLQLFLSWYMQADWLALLLRATIALGFFARVAVIGKILWFNVVLDLARAVMLITVGATLRFMGDDPRFVLSGIDVRTFVIAVGVFVLAICVAEVWALTRVDTVRWFNRDIDDKMIRAGL